MEEIQDKISKTKSKSGVETLKKSLAEVENEMQEVEKKVADVQKEERVSGY